MKKLLIPSMVFVLGIGMAGIHAASAATAPSVTAAQIIAKSDSAITTRITSLNKIKANIANYKHLTADQRASVTATVQSSIDAMTALKTKIDSETDLTALKADYASITKDYRIYTVAIPSAKTVAATDKAMANIATYQTTLSALNTRITTAQTAGKNVTAIQAKANDASVKLIDAQTQEQALITAVTSLKVDNGDKTIQASNKTALAAVKTADKAMLADLATVRSDISAIRTGLKTLKA